MVDAGLISLPENQTALAHYMKGDSEVRAAFSTRSDSLLMWRTGKCQRPQQRLRVWSA